MILRQQLLVARVLVGSLIPFAAIAAADGVEDVSYLRWVFMLVFSTVGWAIVHLDTLVEWFKPNDEGRLPWDQYKAVWKARLKIIQNYVASLSAGVAFYLLAKSVPHWVGFSTPIPDMVIFIGIVPAAMGGTATWEWIKKKFKIGGE